MQTKNKTAWLNHLGSWIPVKMIAPLKKKEDAAASRVAKAAERLEKAVVNMNKVTWAEEEKLRKYRNKKNGTADTKQNQTFKTFDGTYKVTIARPVKKTTNDSIFAAQEALRNYIEKQHVGAIPMTILEQFLRLKANKAIPQYLINQLLSLQIKDKEWKRVRELLIDSLDTAGCRRYCEVYKRADNGKYTKLNLNFRQ